MSGTVTNIAHQPTSYTLPPVPPDFDWDHYYNTVVVEDDTPVDNWFVEKQQRMLPAVLHACWTPPANAQAEPRSFIAASDVGVFLEPSYTPIVPDFFLSLDVARPEPVPGQRNRHNSYFMHVAGKPPDLVIEITSETRGGEMEHKPLKYAELGVRYYVVYDPLRRYGKQRLYIYELVDGVYQERADAIFPELGLGLTLWEGVYEDYQKRNWPWLRWTTLTGELIPFPEERLAWAEDLATQESQARRQAERRAHQQAHRAEQEAARAQQEAARATRLAEKLRALGIDPDQE
jgi:Uma2 family endonuclease